MNDKMNEAPKDAFDVWNEYRKDRPIDDIEGLIDLIGPPAAVLPALEQYVSWAEIALLKLKSTARPDQLYNEIDLWFDRKERDIMGLFDVLGGASVKTADAILWALSDDEHCDLCDVIDALHNLYIRTDPVHKFPYESRCRSPVPEYLRPVESRIHDFAMFVYVMFEGAPHECFE